MIETLRDVRVRIAENEPIRLTLDGDFTEERIGDVRIYRPADENCRMIAEGVRIGIDFHWDCEVSMRLAGTIAVVDRGEGRYDLYNILDAETYLKSVISSEMNPDAPLEFLKAHAIISRSWLIGKMYGRHDDSVTDSRLNYNEICTWEDTGDHSGFDVCADDHCQRYQGESRLNPASSEAVKATAGLVLVDRYNEIVDARFSKCCGGTTELFSTCWQNVDYDYLRPVADEWCDLSGMSEEERREVLSRILVSYDQATSDFHDWETRVYASDIERRLHERYNFKSGNVRKLIADKRGPSGRIYRLRIEGENGTFFVGKELEIRRLLSETCLYSSCFDIEECEPGEFLLRGRGWGHGVGLCQIGAAMMSLDGKTCKEILDFYYPGTRIMPVEELLSL